MSENQTAGTAYTFISYPPLGGNKKGGHVLSQFSPQKKGDHTCPHPSSRCYSIFPKLPRPIIIESLFVRSAGNAFASPNTGFIDATFFMVPSRRVFSAIVVATLIALEKHFPASHILFFTAYPPAFVCPEGDAGHGSQL